MSKKDIITLIIATVVIGVSVYFIIMLLSPPKQSATNQTPVQEEDQFKYTKSEIDESTYKTIESLKDYQKPALDGIGKPDLFGGI